MKNNQLIKKLKSYNFKLLKDINFNRKLYIDGIDKRYYWSNGNICREIPYKNGLRNGLCKSYYYNGNIGLEIEYEDGLYNGYYKEYNSNGELIKDRII